MQKHVKSKGMTQWSFDQFHEWFVAGKGFRRSRTYGCLNGQSKEYIEIPADKGVALEDVIWVGTIHHDGTAYEVKLKKRIEAYKDVDLIQADNFATSNQFLGRGSSSGFYPKADRPQL